MPAALVLTATSDDLVKDYLSAMSKARRKTGRSTLMAARSFCGKRERADWSTLPPAQQVDAISKARSFASWLLITGRLTITASVLVRVDLRLGVIARSHAADGYAWFVTACDRLALQQREIDAQWGTLVKITAVTGTTVDRVSTTEFEAARSSLTTAYHSRGMRASGRNIASIFHRLQLTLFHAGKLPDCRRPARRPPVSITGWAAAPTGFTNAARRYLGQIELSLRPNTVHHIEHDLREFGTYLARSHPDVQTCADLTRTHIEAYKTWVAGTPAHRKTTPLNRISIKNRLINLHCFFDRITDWGYPDAPTRPLIYGGDLPLVDKPLPRFLDDAAATKLMRTAHTDPDPLSRLIVELLARTGIRKSELLALTVDAVVQIGSAFWLRIPIGKLHNDRYIPLHPQLKELLDDWITAHRPPGLRSDRLLIEKGRPVTPLRVATALSRAGEQAGIGHVTPHQLRHTLATQAINRGMSLDAIAALLGHKSLDHDDDLRADRRQDRRRRVLRRHREGRSPLRPAPRTLPGQDEGTEMRKLRNEVHRRMLGNGHCARPVGMDCHFESICESCTFFVTTIEFRPTLQAQRDDAQKKGQIGRQKIFDGLLERLDHEAS